MKRRITSVICAAIMAFSAIIPAFAASEESMHAADVLYKLDLFSGVGYTSTGYPVFDLDRAPTRAESITMLVRLLGKEDTARSQKWDMPFNDVADWAKPYVGYAYKNKLASGTSLNTFSGGKNVSAAEYLTFVLRALKYEPNSDFLWHESWVFSDKIGLTSGEYSVKNNTITRGEAAFIAYKALKCNLKDTSTALVKVLSDNGVPLYNHDVAWSGEIYQTDLCDYGFQSVTLNGPIGISATYDQSSGNIYASWADVNPSDTNDAWYGYEIFASNEKNGVYVPAFETSRPNISIPTSDDRSIKYIKVRSVRNPKPVDIYSVTYSKFSNPIPLAKIGPGYVTSSGDSGQAGNEFIEDNNNNTKPAARFYQGTLVPDFGYIYSVECIASHDLSGGATSYSYAYTKAKDWLSNYVQLLKSIGYEELSVDEPHTIIFLTNYDDYIGISMFDADSIIMVVSNITD